MSIVKTEHLAYDYLKYTEDEANPEKVRAVDDVSIEVTRGSFVAILGHNGSGKSTLAKHINALLMPTEGTIWIDGEDTTKEPDLWKLREKAGMVFQNPDNQIIATTVEEDVGFGPENIGIERDEIWRRVEDALEKVGMTSFRHMSPNRLSGGQKQRVAIAGIVAMRPDCIVLDEPTAMLDPSGRKEVISVLHELNRRECVTIILITHYMEEVIGADQIFVMDKGKLVMYGSPRVVFSRAEQLRAMELDVPEVTLLAHELRKEGVPLPDGILTIEELSEETAKILLTPPEERKNSVPGNRVLIIDEDDSEEITDLVTDDRGQDDVLMPEEVGLPEGMMDPVFEENTAEDAVVQLEPESQFIPGIGKLTEEPPTADEITPDDENAAVKADQEPAKDVPVIQLKNVSYTYSQGTAYEVKALQHVNLDIRPGQFIAVIGHTGSGKSTLIQMLNGLLKPTEGQIFFEGDDIHANGYSLRDLRTKVGLVFQYPENQLFEETVLKDVCFGPKNQGLSEEEQKKRAEEALKSVGVKEKYFGQSPFDLSGGQKRRVAIAGVLAMQPKVLILDEPTAGLDPQGRDAILGEAEKLCREKGITVILVSHSMEDVARYADRLIVIGGGTAALDGTPREVFSHAEELESMGLSAPQMAYFIRALREKGIEADPGITTVEEAKKAVLALYRREDIRNGEQVS
ncbi:MAG: energy-coupling factor transporter ATPase [Lachnospiraceae bacterium]|nr:energy-coupling factor transporter ATPase [Lachnospiraceae bacterium]